MEYIHHVMEKYLITSWNITKTTPRGRERERKKERRFKKTLDDI